MNHLFAALLCLLGFAALAAATARQQPLLFGHELTAIASRRLRYAGTVSLVAALWLLVERTGLGLGLVLYSGHTSAAAGCVFCLLVAIERRRDRR